MVHAVSITAVCLYVIYFYYYYYYHNTGSCRLWVQDNVPYFITSCCIIAITHTCHQISLPGSFHEPDSHFSLSAANVTRPDLCLVGDGSISPPVNLWAGPPVKQLVRLLWNVIWSTGDVLNIIFANSTTWCDKIWKIVLDINAAHLAACVVIDNRAVWCNCQVHFSSLWQPLTRFLS